MHERGRAGLDAVDRSAVGVEQQRARAEALGRHRSIQPCASSIAGTCQRRVRRSPTSRGSSHARACPAATRRRDGTRRRSCPGSPPSAAARRGTSTRCRRSVARRRPRARAARRACCSAARGPRNWPDDGDGRSGAGAGVRADREERVGQAADPASAMRATASVACVHGQWTKKSRPAAPDASGTTKLRDDAEVAAATAAAGPVEVGVVLRVADEVAPVGGHDPERDDVVGRRAERARREPDAAALREPGDADGRRTIRSGSPGRAPASAASTSIRRAPAPIVAVPPVCIDDAVQAAQVEGRARSSSSSPRSCARPNEPRAGPCSSAPRRPRRERRRPRRAARRRAAAQRRSARCRRDAPARTPRRRA